MWDTDIYNWEVLKYEYMYWENKWRKRAKEFNMNMFINKSKMLFDNLKYNSVIIHNCQFLFCCMKLIILDTWGNRVMS